QHAGPAVGGGVWPSSRVDRPVPAGVSEWRGEGVVVELFDQIEVRHHVKHGNVDPLTEACDMPTMDGGEARVDHRQGADFVDDDVGGVLRTTLGLLVDVGQSAG